MRIGFHSKNVIDENGNPTGGVVVGTGFTIAWQDGPLGRGEDRKAPTGAFVEDVIDAARQRIEFMNSASDGRFRCQENVEAIWHLEAAQTWLDRRTKRRESANIEGTHAEESSK